MGSYTGIYVLTVSVQYSHRYTLCLHGNYTSTVVCIQIRSPSGRRSRGCRQKRHSRGCPRSPRPVRTSSHNQSTLMLGYEVEMYLLIGSIPCQLGHNIQT